MSVRWQYSSLQLHPETNITRNVSRDKRTLNKYAYVLVFVRVFSTVNIIEFWMMMSAQNYLLPAGSSMGAWKRSGLGTSNVPRFSPDSPPHLNN